MQPEHRIAEALPLVKLVARSVATTLPNHIDLGELEAAGTLGLVEAAGRFDEGRGVPFEAFARQRIRGAILDAARRQDFASRSLRRWGRAIETATRGLLHELGQQPTDEQVAARLGVSVRKLSKLRARIREAALLRLEGARGDSVDDDGFEVVGDEDPAVELVRREQLSLLGDALAALPDRLKYVVDTTYIEGRPLCEVAAELGVTESRVSQLRNEALTWLRQVLEPTSQPGTGARAARIVGWGEAVVMTRDWKSRISAAA